MTNPLPAVGLAYLATLEQAFDVIRATDMTDEQIKYARRRAMARVTYCTHDKGPTICGGFDRNCPLKKSKNKA